MNLDSNVTAHTAGEVCPECGETEVFAHPEGKLRHCFACGGYATSTPLTGVAAVMDGIFKASHRQLLEAAETLTYLTEDRGLHPQVLVDSMIGLLPPDLDVTSLFMPMLDGAEAALARVLALPRKPGRPTKKEQEAIDLANSRVERLKEHRDRIAALEEHAGRLVFFYTDTLHLIVRVHVEPVGGGESVWLKVGDTPGVFNHGLFVPGLPARSLEDLRGRSIVVSSEFDLLHLQSVAARLAESEGLQPQAGYVKAVAVGESDVDAKTIRTLGRLPLLIRTSGGSGRAMVEAIRQELNVFQASVPTGTTLGGLLRGLSDLDARQALLQLAGAQTLVTRPFEQVATEIDSWRSLEERAVKKFESDRWSSGVLVRDASERGQLFYDGRVAYVFDRASKQLLPADRDNADMLLFLNQYGIAPTDGFLKHALSAVKMKAQTHGTQTTVHSLSHYDRATNRLYLFDHDRHIYRITRSSIEQVDNGTDGVLFVRNPNYERFEIGVPKGEGHVLTDTLLGSVRLREQVLSRAEQERLFAHWLYAMFFPELFPTRPILAVIGEKGSGKTSILRRLGQLLFGSKFQVMGMSHEPRDFDAAVTGEGFVAIDNADADVSWLNDKLAVVATGGTLKRREYYTTNNLIEFPITAFVGITSRTPHFKREDVADRLLLFHIDRLIGFESEATLLAKLIAQRNDVMTELVGQLQRVLAALDQNEGKAYKSNFRIADFGEFVLKVADAQGTLSEAQATFDRLGQAQLAFTVQDDPVIDVLESWVSVKGNAGRELTTGQLFMDLRHHAACSQPAQLFEFNKAVGFGAYLETKKATLAAIFGASERTVGSRRRLWRFYPPADAVGKDEEAVTEEIGIEEFEVLLQGMSNLRRE